jgi:hypothetical protein
MSTNVVRVKRERIIGVQITFGQERPNRKRQSDVVWQCQ